MTNMLMLMAIITRTLGKSFVFYTGLQILINCLIYASSAFMAYQCVKKLTNSRNTATLAWSFFLILLGTSPWIVVSYSDSLALFIPILLVTVRLFYRKNRLVRFGLMAFLAILGFYIKPQVSIVFIAYVLLDGFEALTQKRFKDILGSILIFVLIGLLITTPLNAVKDKYLDRDKEIGMAHYFLIGMNYETQGMYSADDLAFSCSFKTREERNRADLEKALERIESYGMPKFLKHLRNKTVLTYNDGTFSFGDEGQFYNDFFPTVHLPLTDLFREIFLDFGKYYRYPSIIRQAAWICTLLLGFLSSLFKKKDGTIDLVRLSLVGLFLFELLFESRGRYLLTYVPLFVLLACTGFKDLLDFFRKNKKQS